MSTDLPVPETRVLAVASHVRKENAMISFFCICPSPPPFPEFSFSQLFPVLTTMKRSSPGKSLLSFFLPLHIVARRRGNTRIKTDAGLGLSLRLVAARPFLI